MAIPMIVALALPAAAQSNDEISKRLDAIEKRLDTLEAIPNLGALILQQVQKNAAETQPRSTGKGDMVDTPEQPKFSARLVDIKPAGKGILGDQGYKITVEVTNDSGRDADLINARVRFEDRLGNSLTWIKWEKSKGIAAGKTVRMSGTYSDSMGDNLERLAEIDRALLATKFDIYKIAYKDGEVVTIKECAICDF
jgi:hypothetical protein